MRAGRCVLPGISMYGIRRVKCLEDSFLAPKGKGNNGVTTLPRSSFRLGENFCFEIVGVCVEFARGDLFRGRAMKAKFANTEAAFRA